MSLRGLNLKAVYRTGVDNLMEDFYIPCLRECIKYDRAVGFFTSSVLAYGMSGVAKLITNGGKMRLIIGSPLDDEEYEALKAGKNLKKLGEKLVKELEVLVEGSESTALEIRLKLFFLMIVTEKLDIRFAYRRSGMYHEKIGIMEDSDGNKILFQGSANETASALNEDLNYESINIYPSWEEDVYEKYGMPYEKGFEDIWNGKDKHVITIDMPSELYSKIQDKAKEKNLNSFLDIIACDGDSDTIKCEVNEDVVDLYCKPQVPDAVSGRKFSLFPHQESALKAWAENEYKGIFKLATGAGKTITAMYAVAKLMQANRELRLVYVVAVPYVALAEQWVNEMRLFNIHPIQCFGSKDAWEEKLKASINQFKLNRVDFFSIVVVNKTLTSEIFKSEISRLSKTEIFFIGDECHHHSSKNLAESVPEAKYKIGLSATPYSLKIDAGFETDPIKIETLKSVYGDVVSEYNLANALGDGVLTPYDYHISLVRLDDDEMDLYHEISKQIARLIAIEQGDMSIKLKGLIRRRNKIISNASEKVPALERLLSEIKIKDKEHTLIYVGEGPAAENEDTNETDISQLQAVSEVMMKKNWKVAKFTATENKKDRSTIMDDFKNGNIDALVSMRVLDEGIDIPLCKRAFILASTTNSRQFVQRRGRILRKAVGKKKAEIFDFVVIPQSYGKDKSCFVSLVERELYRVMDFVRLAENRKQVQRVAEDLAYSFGLDAKGL